MTDFLNISKPDKNRELQIIELVQQIMKNSSLSLYADLWLKAGFAITKNYRAKEYVDTILRFASIPLYQQVSEFRMRETSCEDTTAQHLIDLITPLLQTKRCYDYFDLWSNNGFHITPIWETKNEQPEFEPTFFLLGAAKSGTTTLHSYLREIPSICMSWPKEPFFFEAEYELGLDFYRQRYFEHWKGEPIVGDARHRNLYLPFIAERIFAVNPDAKLIICVRNPIERAFSHWWFWYAMGVESLGFEQAVEEDMERIQAGWLTKTAHEIAVYKETLDWTGKGIYRSYIDSGYYYEQLCQYLKYFSKEQMKIVLFDGLEQDSFSIIKEMEFFIGTNHYRKDNFLPQKKNAHLPDSPERKRTPISPKFRTFLEDHYQKHNANLAEFIGKDLSHWQ